MDDVGPDGITADDAGGLRFEMMTILKDEAFKTSGDLRLYHGTCELYLPSILIDGLMPGRGWGGDTWMQHRGLIPPRDLRAPSVYVTSEVGFAEGFAHVCAFINGSKACVVEIAVPGELFKELFAIDEVGVSFEDTMLIGRPISFRTEEPIPAAAIAHVYHLHPATKAVARAVAMGAPPFTVGIGEKASCEPAIELEE